jgi:multidrug resistance efflux pump
MAPTAFSKTYAALLAERGRSNSLTLVATLLALGAWTWWAIKSELTLYEVSTSARVELDSATYPIQSPFAGKIVRTNISVGKDVKLGDILVEIDSEPDQLQLRQEQVRVLGLDPALDRLRSQLTAEERAREDEQSASRGAAEEAANKIREAESAAKYAELELARVQKLIQEGLAPQRDLDKAQSEVRRLRGAVTTLESAAKRIPQDQFTRDRDRESRLQRIHSEIAKIEAERGTVNAGIKRLGYEIERRRVRAPISGRVGESALLRLGAVVREGEPLGSIIPDGQLIVAAQYAANSAFGRIRAGQKGTLRLDGFPWAEFGTLTVTVHRVAQEVRDGKVRVELRIEPSSTFQSKLQHGMPGSLEIAVERTAPASLVLRMAGQLLTAAR